MGHPAEELLIERKHIFYMIDTENKDPSSDYINFYDTRYVTIDYPKLSKDQKDIPLIFLKEYERPAPHTGFIFAQCPKDSRRMLVIDRVDMRGQHHSFSRCFEVAMGTKTGVINVLLQGIRASKRGTWPPRLKFDYGDVNTLRSWEETYDVTGRIGHTTGKRSAFILLDNKRSNGGGIIMTDCILSICETKAPHTCRYVLNEPLTNPLKEIT